MSEASRAAALAHAAMVHQGSGDAVATIETAEAFHAFISPAAETEAPAKATPTKTVAKTPAKATPVKTATPAKKKVATPPPDDDAEADAEEGAEEGEVTKEMLGESIEALLNANMRPQAIKLFGKYNAKSLSGISAEDYAACKQDADDLLLNS